MKQPLVSVVIPTFERIPLLRRCLDALSAQDFDPGQFEIVVVDDARSETARQFVESYASTRPEPQAGPDIRYTRPPDGARGPAAARNAGWKIARADIVAFTDDDTLPTPNWLHEGLRAMSAGTDGNVAAAWGHVTVPLPEKPTDAERNVGGLEGAEFVTANCFVRRAALVMCGGFDERFKRAWREDSDFYFTLLENGWKVVAAPSAVVVHPARKAPPGTCLKQHRNLLFDALLYKKHRQLYRMKISTKPPLHYYLTAGLLGLAGVGAATGHPLLAALGGAGWLAMTLRLIVRRARGTSPALGHRLEVAATSFAIPFLAIFWRLAGALRYRVLFA